MLKLTVPPPVPLVGFTFVIQLALLDALHVHPVPPLTVVEPGPPPLPTFALDGAIDRPQSAACVTVSV